jgi:dsDNA-specific endonuclease/ATPase MutS2
MYSEKTVKNIDFDYIFNEVKPITEYGINIKKNIIPFVKGQEKELLEELEKVNEFIKIDNRRELVDIFRQIKNITEIIESSKNNQVLDEVELFEIKNFLILLKKIKDVLKHVSVSSYEDLSIIPLPHLYELLDPCNERMSTFYIYDDYSLNLKRIRYDIKEIGKKINQLKKEIKHNLERKYGVRFNFRDEITINKINEERNEKLLSEKNLRISGENYLTYILTINNSELIDEYEKKLEKFKVEEKNEEYIIRQKISKEINNDYDIFKYNFNSIGRIDFCLAKANYAIESKFALPQISDNLEFVIKGGRNLKLEKSLKDNDKNYTPIDLTLNKNVVCITGANMGGKTVSLRMIGQIALCVSYGMFVPCDYAKICLFEYIYISVGDEQSIEKGLSSFGAEIVNLKEAIDNSDKRSLILIDELAGGTNPKEGYAITKAVINYMKKRKCITVITTHYDNVIDDEIQNLQVAGLKLPEDINIIGSIDQISKYMDYNLIEIKNKSSIPKDALNIAKIAGIKDEIIEEAEKYL